ncbi:MAG: metallophosphoesterase family protein [Bacillota bacterium]|jgi:DNA repair exonuclease SbcCD nuclease subunit
MNLMFITDTHLRGTTPRSRKDNLPQTQIKKLQEMAGLAEEYGVRAILHGGDMFDLPGPALTVAASIDILRSTGAEIYAVAGNHDIYGYNPETLDRTMLGFMARMGLVKLLNPGEPVYLTDGQVTVQLTGQHFHPDIDRREPDLDYAVRKQNCDLAVHIVHGMLTDRPMYHGVAHTLIEQVAHFTEADYTLCGHAHFGFADWSLGGKHFINPGAVVRLTAHPVEMVRKPGVLILNFSASPPGHRHIPLKSALPGEEVLDRAHLEEIVFRKEKLQLLLKDIQSSGEFKSANLEDLILEIADNRELPGQVRREALARIARSRDCLEPK